jgi:two pore calcium channel protein
LRCIARLLRRLLNRLFLVVQHPRFENLVDAMLLVNAITLISMSWYRLGDSACNGGDDDGGDPGATDGIINTPFDFVQVFLTAFFTLEMFCKIGALGFRRYWSNWCSRFDMVVTILTFALVVIVYSPGANTLHGLGLRDERVITYMWLVRLTRLSRCLRYVTRFEVLILTLQSLIPAAGRLLRLLFCVFFLYSVLGMHIFGGLITTNPADPNYAKLNATDYGQSGYYPNNFNDMWSGFVTLFELLVVNNWFEVVDGFVAVTAIEARWYFISFYVLGVLVCFNIVVASVLDTFSDENKMQYQIAGEATAIHNLRTGEYEADIKASTAIFDASHITGTRTDLQGRYMVALSRNTGRSHEWLQRMFRGQQGGASPSNQQSSAPGTPTTREEQEEPLLTHSHQSEKGGGEHIAL